MSQRDLMNVKVWLGVIVFVALLVGLQSNASAAETTANTLKVSPVRTDVEIMPGETKTVQATVTNLTDEPITVRPIQNDFISGDERGTPALILDENEFAPTHSLKRFLKPLEDVTIPAGLARTIKVVISVPKGVQAGGYFGAIRFAPTSPDSGGQVNLNASVASLILMSVPGDTIEQLNLTNFDVQQNGKPGTFFTTPKDLTAAVRFENKGNVQIGPFGKVTVMRGDTVVYEANFNNEDPRDVVLPDSARRWDIPLEKIGAFGNYTVNATFTYGKKNQTVEVVQSFWVVPQAVLIGAIVGFVLLIALIVGIILYLRKSKHSRRASRNHGKIGFRR